MCTSVYDILLCRYCGTKVVSLKLALVCVEISHIQSIFYIVITLGA